MSTSGSMNLAERYPPAMVPRYITPEPNAPTPLPCKLIKAVTESGEIETPVTASLEWTPFPHVQIVATGLPFDPPSEPYLAVFPIESKIQAVGLAWGSSRKTNDRVETRWIAKPMPPGSLPECHSVTFHLVSFPEVWGFPVESIDGARANAGRMEFQLGEYTCTIDPILIDAGWYKSREAPNGQYIITHFGQVKRADSVPLDSDQSEDVLELLWLALSFFRGAWCSPMLLAGHGSNGEFEWECWRVGRMDPRNGTGSWRFNPTKETFGFMPGLVQRLRSPIWIEPIKTAIHWYVECNTSNNDPEGAIILQQAAFEALAWTLLVEERKVLSEKGAGDLSAADKIRLLLSDCRIPLTIPDSLADLRAAAKQFNWPNGPQALTEVRNALVHANPKRREKMHKAGPNARIDAYCLGQWYLELILLWLFGYRGRYSNRLLRGVSREKSLERVPWATAGTNP